VIQAKIKYVRQVSASICNNIFKQIGFTSFGEESCYIRRDIQAKNPYFAFSLLALYKHVTYKRLLARFLSCSYSYLISISLFFLFDLIPIRTETNSSLYHCQKFLSKRQPFVVRSLIKAFICVSLGKWQTSNCFVACLPFLILPSVAINKVQIFSVKRIQFIVKNAFKSLNCIFKNKLGVFDWRNLHFVYIQEHIGMTNIKLLASRPWMCF